MLIKALLGSTRESISIAPRLYTVIPMLLEDICIDFKATEQSIRHFLYAWRIYRNQATDIEDDDCFVVRRNETRKLRTKPYERETRIHHSFPH